MITKTVIIDCGGLFHSNFFVSNNMKDLNQTEQFTFWKFLVLNSIRKSKFKFKPDELILACDNRSWRKSYFKFYKAKRVIDKTKSDIDWNLFFEEIKKFLDEIKEYFPKYKIIDVNGAEADDITAVVTHGLRNIRKDIIIVGRDHDFKQLLSKNVRMYDPINHKFIVCDNPKSFLLNHILIGDPGDGIPNIRSDDDTFIDTAKRQKPFGPKTIEKVLISGLQKYIEENDLQKNYDRNRKLVELSPEMIPKRLQREIFKSYKSYTNDAKNKFIDIQRYFARNNFRSFLEKTEHFI